MNASLQKSADNQNVANLVAEALEKGLLKKEATQIAFGGDDAIEAKRAELNDENIAWTMFSEHPLIQKQMHAWAESVGVDLRKVPENAKSPPKRRASFSQMMMLNVPTGSKSPPKSKPQRRQSFTSVAGFMVPSKKSEDGEVSESKLPIQVEAIGKSWSAFMLSDFATLCVKYLSVPAPPKVDASLFCEVTPSPGHISRTCLAILHRMDLRPTKLDGPRRSDYAGWRGSFWGGDARIQT